MFSKNKRATAGLQRLLISLENGTATFFESDSQLFRVDNNLYAGRQTHQIICIRQRIRFVEIIDTPGEPPLRVAPGSKTADMEISYCQYFGGITQAGAYVRPELSPPVKCPAKKEEWAVSHLLVLQSQVGLDDRRTTAHPVFVALGRLMNIHFSAALCASVESSASCAPRAAVAPAATCAAGDRVCLDCSLLRGIRSNPRGFPTRQLLSLLVRLQSWGSDHQATVSV